MSVERSFEAWEEVQRHGLDLADKLTQSFTDIIQTHITPKLFDVELHTHKFVEQDLRFLINNNNHNNNNASYGINGVSAIFDIGNKLGQVGLEFGTSLNGAVHQFFSSLPVPFRNEDDSVVVRVDSHSGVHKDGGLGIGIKVDEEDLGALANRFKDFGFDDDIEKVKDDSGGEDVAGWNLKDAGFSGRSQGTLNLSTIFDSRTCGMESSLAARGDFWRVEASHGSSTFGNGNSSLFLVQLGPVLFVRDSTLLLPVHLSKQHLLWYGYDRKNGVHSLCPAVWTKHRRWLLMSMLCLNPMNCSFMDLQFPNGQVTYVAGEGISTSAFLPLFGGLLQAQGQYPGEMKFSFSCKNKWGTRITPMVQVPAKSFTLGFEQALAWKRSGIMVRPTVQFSLQPTLGGNNPGVKAELVHSLNEELSLIGGCSLVSHPSAFASLSLGRSKWNGNVGKTGIVLRVETPLADVGEPSFSVQINSGIEF